MWKELEESTRNILIFAVGIFAGVMGFISLMACLIQQAVVYAIIAAFLGSVTFLIINIGSNYGKTQKDKRIKLENENGGK